MTRGCVGLGFALVSACAFASCPPGTVARGVYTKQCYPVATGSSGGGGGYGGAGAQLGGQIGAGLGALINQGLFGSQPPSAEYQAALQAQRQMEEQERQRAAEERARQEEERYQRLRTSLLDFNPAPQLSLMGVQPGAGGLQLMLGDDAERSTKPSLAELARAAAWSTLAAGAPTPEDAANLADAAFQSAVGLQVTLPPPPPDVKGVPVGPPIVSDFERLKKEYLDLRKQLPEAAKPVLDAEYRKELAAHLEEDARAAEQAVTQQSQKAQAREALKEAQRMRQKAEDDLRSAREKLEQTQAKANASEEGIRRILANMAAPRSGQVPKTDSYFYTGFQHGSLCFASNLTVCNAAPAADLQNCRESYRLGYAAGEKIKVGMIQDAGERGRRDKQAGRNYADTDPRAQGSCRTHYMMAYNDGYFGWRINFVGR